MLQVCLTRTAVTVALSVLLASCGWFQDFPSTPSSTRKKPPWTLVGVNTDWVEVELATLETGGRYDEPIGRDDCVDFGLTARTSDGDIFARQTEEVCADGEWIITGPDS